MGHREMVAFIEAMSLRLALMHGEEPGVADVLKRLGEQDISPAAYQSVSPLRLPVCRLLPDAVGASLGCAPELAGQIAGIEDHLHWCQNPAYSDEAMGQAGYMDHYGYSVIIGKGGFFAGDDFLLTVFLLGPNMHYLDHYHPAPELYLFLTGPHLGKRGVGDWAETPAGATIWHEPNEVHATKTGDDPLLALTFWTRDTDQAARLVG